MKISTKVAIAVNVICAGAVSYFAYDLAQEEKNHRAQIDVIVEQVAIEADKYRQLECLATNVYHEARNEGITGQRAVAWATLNRVKSKRYPNTICEVVYQAELKENGIPYRNKCQFSWFCDGKSDEVTDQAAWNVAMQIAEEVTSAFGSETDPTNGAFMYHAHYVTPYWASSYDRQVRIDSHIFYN
jgi:spore germination cell wall hydrolase CwlJ-like protein